MIHLELLDVPVNATTGWNIKSNKVSFQKEGLPMIYG